MDLNTGNFLLIGSILLFISILAAKTGSRHGIPLLLLFLGVGMLFGTDGFGIEFNNAPIAQFIGMMALSIILFSGGMETRMSEIKPILGQGIMLSTIGLLITTLVTGGIIFFVSQLFRGIPNLTIAQSLLLGAVMSSTDSASVFSILRSKKMVLKENLRPLLELESGSNDPVAYLLMILCIQFIQSAGMSFGNAAMMLIVQLVVGTLSGLVLGKLATLAVNRLNIENQSLYPILLLAYAFFVFSFTDLIHGNGYLAVYIAGLMVGNHKIVHKRTITVFFDGIAWLSQLVMFLALGLLVNPREVLSIVGSGLLIGGVLILIARPIGVWVSLLPFPQMTRNAKLFVSWVGLKGAVPIIFATYPLIAKLEYAQLMFNIVFFVTILSLLVQGTTIETVARWLKVGHREKERSTGFSDFDLPEGMKSMISEIEVTSEMLVHGEMLMNLDLPEHILVVTIQRDDLFFVPHGKVLLQPGDTLLMLSDGEPMPGAISLSSSK